MTTKIECPTCEGAGYTYLGDTSKKWGDRWVPDDDYAECKTCNGDKVIDDPTCPVCKGAGSVPVNVWTMACTNCAGNGVLRPDRGERLAKIRTLRYIELPTDAADRLRDEGDER